MKAIQEEPSLELQIIATGMHLSPEFGLTVENIEADGFPIAGAVTKTGRLYLVDLAGSEMVKKTEAELLSYKNFGETSLNEIKEILGSKGLRLGMAREEAVASVDVGRNRYAGMENADALNRPLADLELSIRARRTVETLGCLTLGDIVQHSEEELLGMPNFGQTSLIELRERLDHGQADRAHRFAFLAVGKP